MNNEVSLNRIRLELAQTTGCPTESTWDSYEFVAPLTADGRVDLDAWRQLKDVCHVTRFWGDEPEGRGQFVRMGSEWYFKYPESKQVERETLFKLDRHRFTPGGYITITEPGGERRPFRVVAMTPTLVCALAPN